MSFLQPMLLFALPLIALPIVIHLINQRRYQTIQWAAMMFLLAANRMSRGYARLRQWWILLFRMLAIAGLIFAVSRPLASGWLGMAAGGKADTTMILLDRSPSMRQQGPGMAASKWETGRQQIVRTLNTLNSARWVLIDSTTNSPRELDSPDSLLRVTSAEPTSAPADLPSMLQAARDYIQSNKPGRTEIWICSDMRENDWNAADGRWQALRDSFIDSQQSVRFHLLAYPDTAPDNLSIRVTDVRRRQTSDSAELLVSLRLARADGDAASAVHPRLAVPVQFEIGGARSEITLEMSANEFELKDHRIPLDRNQQRGWGKVSIPADANPSDNDFYFVFDEPIVRRTMIVAEDAQAARPLQLAATISPDPAVSCAADVATPGQLATIEWEKFSLVLWHAPLPVGEVAQRLQSLIDCGGQVVFFPPRALSAEVFAGVSWKSWVEPPRIASIVTWRGDQDLLAHTQSGAALPLGQLTIRRYCAISGEHTPLAVISGGASLLGRAATSRGGVYFCSTTAAGTDSSLGANGVVLYVLVQRALAAGAAVVGDTRQVAAGDLAVVSAERPQTWRQVAGPPDAISTDFAFYSGIYETGEKLFAVNSPASEDHSGVLTDQRVAALFAGLDFARVDDQAGSLAALINEIWRPFLAAMILALIVEAILCMPRPAPPAVVTAPLPA